MWRNKLKIFLAKGGKLETLPTANYRASLN
jgi:hypothetical protein